jgi:hypothetical protein
MTTAELMAGYASYTTAEELSACRGAAGNDAGRITTSAEGTTSLAYQLSSSISLGYSALAGFDDVSGIGA